jgi:hypothetical protein
LAIFYLETTNSSIIPSSLNSQLHVTMTMTLRLAEKNAYPELWDFKTLEPSTRTQSTVLILIHDQQSRSTSELRTSKVSTFNLRFPPEYFLPEVQN